MGLDLAGTPHWFYGLSREEQIDVLALVEVEEVERIEDAKRAERPPAHLRAR